MNKENCMINWLLEGDPAIVYHTQRDLLDTGKSKLLKLQKEIVKSGWGKRFLSKRDNKTGLWGKDYYSPKWISTTYTLLDIKHLGIDPNLKEYKESCEILLNKLWNQPTRKDKDWGWLDLCICGMLLDLCCYARIKSYKIDEIVDYIIEKHFPDGAWNCLWKQKPHHSSLHTTINILEGLYEYFRNGYTYRKKELKVAVKQAHEFILMHRLYKSDKTRKIITKQMTMLSYPSRWWYDILRALDYFQAAKVKYDERMSDAIEVIMQKRRKDGFWPVQNKKVGLVHFDMEKTGGKSRWNTLRVLRVLKKYRSDLFSEIVNKEYFLNPKF